MNHKQRDYRSAMDDPWWFWYAIVIVFLVLVVLCITLYYNSYPFIEILQTIVGFLTIILLSLTVYYSSKTAREAWTPVASLILNQDENSRYTIISEVRNHSKIPLEVGCKLNPRINGKDISMDDFYGGKWLWIIPPLRGGRGHFTMNDILNKIGEYSHTTKLKRVDFHVQFWYHPIGKEKKKVSIPILRYYYDLQLKRLSLDI